MRAICWVDLGPPGLFLEGGPVSTENWHDHGLGMLRTILHAAGIPTDVESVKNYAQLDPLIRRLAAYDLLLMNVRSYNFFQAREIAERYKAIRPAGLVITGGMHAIIDRPQMESVAAFDRICVGPGEGIVADLVREPERHPRVVAGVSARSMDDWPEIDRTLWPKPRRADYPWPLELGIPNWNPGVLASVITSRVCPWRCSFCNEGAYIAPVRRKRVETVIRELNRLDERHGPVDSVIIHDSMFFQHPDWLAEWCEKYPRLARRKWPYWAAARADTVRKWPELFIRLVLETNWNMVSIGLESGSDRILRTLNKECTVEDNVYVIDLVNRLGDIQEARGERPVRLFSNVMFGIPGETREDVLDTMNMFYMVKRNIMSPSLYAPYPGGALGYQLIAEGKSLLEAAGLDRTPNADKVRGIDYAFIRECWAGARFAEIVARQGEWLARHLRSGVLEKLEGGRPPHHFYLFPLRGGGKAKIAWGESPECAAETLRQRLTAEEVAGVDFDRHERILQGELPAVVPRLG